MIVFDAQSSSNQSSSATWTQAHTMSASANGFLVVHLYYPGGAAINSVQYNGVNMTRQTDIVGSSFILVTFVLANPSSGTNNIVVSWTGAVAGRMGAMSFTGVDSSSPDDQQVDSTNTASPYTTHTVACNQTNEYTVSVNVIESGGSIAVSGMTSSGWTNGGGIFLGGYRSESTTGNKTHAYTFTGTNLNDSSILSLKPFVPATNLGRMFAMFR